MDNKLFREYLKEKCDEAGSIMAWSNAQKPKISHSYVSAVIRGDAPIGKKILKALKMKKAHCFLAKGDAVVMKFEDV